ncbi:MAG: transposase [Lewinellaceae bacterium]|nr:transposase [Lewinellaceae bacterium]
MYTKIIVGYRVSDHMRAVANVEALKHALRHYGPPKYHHSDRGSQYGYKEYIKLLRDNKVAISMGQSAQDNAYAERVHRTIKEEYLYYWKPQSLKQLQQCTAKAVKHYNQHRIHNSLGRSPFNFAQYWAKLNQSQRPEITIYDDQFLT